MTIVKPAQNRLRRTFDGDGSILRIRLLGPFGITSPAGSVALPSKRARALLAILVRRGGQPIARAQAAAMLWGERAEEQARASLRQTLSELRQAFAATGVEPVAGTSDMLAWDAAAAPADTDEVETAAASSDPAMLKSAVTLLRGDFLEGFSLGEPEFERWLSAERAVLQRHAVTIHTRLMTLAEQSGDTAEALVHGEKLLALDPWQEQVHRAVMQLLAGQHRHDAALAHYERLKRDLESELGVSPAPETEALMRRIRQSRRAPAPPPSPSPSPSLQEAKPPAPPPPAKPSLVVLPFHNLSNDPAQDLFASGMAEDIIGALSRLEELFVISRGAAFAFKGTTAEAARELGVRYVLDGSVRVAGSRVRVTAQLLDSQTGITVWSDRYEGDLAEIFTVQDTITHAIAVALQVKLAHGDSARIWEGRTRNLAAWEKLMLGRAAFHRHTTADNVIARTLLEEALVHDPQCTGAMTLIGFSHYWDARFSVDIDQQAALARAEDYEARILAAAEPGMPGGLILHGMIALVKGDYDDAIASTGRAVTEAPSDSFSLRIHGLICLYAGNLEAAARNLKASLRLHPAQSAVAVYYLLLCEFWRRDHAAADVMWAEYEQLSPIEPYGLAYQAANLAARGRDGEARAMIARLRETSPRFGLRNIRSSELYRNPDWRAELIALLAGAGLPD